MCSTKARSSERSRSEIVTCGLAWQVDTVHLEASTLVCSATDGAPLRWADRRAVRTLPSDLRNYSFLQTLQVRPSEEQHLSGTLFSSSFLSMSHREEKGAGSHTSDLTGSRVQLLAFTGCPWTPSSTGTARRSLVRAMVTSVGHETNERMPKVDDVVPGQPLQPL